MPAPNPPPMRGSDLTFIGIEPGQKLSDRFCRLIQDCQSFDCLVAYFCVSGFYGIYQALEAAESIRILIGIGTTPQTYELLREADSSDEGFKPLSHYETAAIIEDTLEAEMANSDDNPDVERGIMKFVEWLKKKKNTGESLPLAQTSRQALYYDLSAR